MTIGILAFQGGVEEHAEALSALAVSSLEVRSLSALQQVNALIIPGGESTVIMKFLQKTGLDQEIIKRSKEGLPIYGTCAGAIVLSKGMIEATNVRGVHGRPDAAPLQHDVRVRPLGLMDVSLDRNAYGPQTESFQAPIELSLPSGMHTITGIFIRAPKVARIGEGVTVLAAHEGAPVVLREGNLLASTFHPELARGRFLHEYFISQIVDKS